MSDNWFPITDEMIQAGVSVLADYGLSQREASSLDQVLVEQILVAARTVLGRGIADGTTTGN